MDRGSNFRHLTHSTSRRLPGKKNTIVLSYGEGYQIFPFHLFLTPPAV